MMRAHAASIFRALDRVLLAGASLLVAHPQRLDWRREWDGELWQVRHAHTSAAPFSLRAERTILSFCIGAFSDAWCLRRVETRPAFKLHRSAVECLLCLASALGVLALVAHMLPGLDSEHDALRDPVRPALVLIQQAGSAGAPTPAVTPATFRAWRATPQHNFDELAFYQSARERVFIDAHRPVSLRVAHASDNLIALLGKPLLLGTAPGPGDAPSVVLSRRAWHALFAADRNVVGKQLRIGSRSIPIAGVALSTSLTLPGEPDLWVLGLPIDAHTPNSKGFVLAHLSPRGQRAFDAFGDDLPIATADDDPDQPSLVGVKLRDQATGTANIARFALLLAFLALPAVVSVSLNESTFSLYQPSWTRQLLRGLFLAAKCALVCAIAYCASLILAYGFIETYTTSAEFVQLIAEFALSLLGLRWAVLDQRHRCPVCLRHVAHPARVGSFSQTFLGWSGTEMFCAGGHTLLHVPTLPTSWFHGPRWVYLDPSWRSLFITPTP